MIVYNIVYIVKITKMTAINEICYVNKWECFKLIFIFWHVEQCIFSYIAMWSKTNCTARVGGELPSVNITWPQQTHGELKAHIFDDKDWYRNSPWETTKPLARFHMFIFKKKVNNLCNSNTTTILKIGGKDKSKQRTILFLQKLHFHNNNFSRFRFRKLVHERRRKKFETAM